MFEERAGKLLYDRLTSLGIIDDQIDKLVEQEHTKGEVYLFIAGGFFGGSDFFSPIGYMSSQIYYILKP